MVTAVVTALDYILPAYFSKMFGGSRAGIIGATVGVFAGMILLGPLGIVLGPRRSRRGRVAARQRECRQSTESGIRIARVVFRRFGNEDRRLGVHDVLHLERYDGRTRLDVVMLRICCDRT